MCQKGKGKSHLIHRFPESGDSDSREPRKAEVVVMRIVG